MTTRHNNRRRPPSRSRGIALLAVLVLVAGLTLLASSVVALSVSQRRAADTFARIAQANNTADSAIRVLILKLIAPEPAAAARLPERQQHIDIFGTPVSLTLEREATRIDLNFADEKVLAAGLIQAGWGEKSANETAARILDWRDADDTPRPGGAENREYAAAGLAYGPRNAPFESVDEVRQVLGCQGVTDRLLDVFTVYSHRETPVSDAPAPTSLIGEVVRIDACLQLSGNERCRFAVVRLTGSTHKPTQIFKWDTRTEIFEKTS